MTLLDTWENDDVSQWILKQKTPTESLSDSFHVYHQHRMTFSSTFISSFSSHIAHELNSRVKRFSSANSKQTTTWNGPSRYGRGEENRFHLESCSALSLAWCGVVFAWGIKNVKQKKGGKERKEWGKIKVKLLNIVLRFILIPSIFILLPSYTRPQAEDVRPSQGCFRQRFFFLLQWETEQ